MDAPPPRRRRRYLLVSVLTLGIAVALAISLLTSAESRALGSAMAGWISQSRAGAVLEADFTPVSVEGLPKEMAGIPITLRWRSPDRLFVQTKVKNEEVEAGRDGRTIWIHLPKKPFTIIGDDSVPRFSGDANSIEPVDLPDFSIPFSPWQARLLPFLVEVKSTPDPEGGEPWQHLVPSQIGRGWFGLPEGHIETRPGTGETREIRLIRPDQPAVHLRINRLAFRETSLPEPSWSPPQNAVADRVALSHLVRCAGVIRSRLGAKTPSLPAASGSVELVAKSGRGRLEGHDGVRVLFLAGTPEEMGKQQGELLHAEVRSVVERIVYGVGVGSSFAKGRWFFGEIEEAQSRIEPFIPASHLREMDAIADAAGLHRQEARLANFFPELFHCSGFALHGTATADGQIYHGRILDYIRGAGLEDNAVVSICRPEGANAWVNVSYAGFIGSVTAMNEKQLAIGEMGGRGEGAWDGKPMAQLVREVMETCDTIDEAVALMRKGPRTCEYYYVISDAKSGRAVGIKATPDLFETVWSGESHPQLSDPVADTVLLSAGDRYTELVRRVKEGFGRFDADSARALMTHPVCMDSNIQSVLFAPGTLDFWVANADSENVASHTRYTRFNLREMLDDPDPPTSSP